MVSGGVSGVTRRAVRARGGVDIADADAVGDVHWMFVAGLVLAIAFIGVAYLRAAPNYQSSNGVDGEMFLGRWWDPQFTVTLAIIGYVGWALGIAVGLLLRGTLDALHPRKSERLP